MNKELKKLWGDQVDYLVKRLNEYSEGELKECQLCMYASQIAQVTFVCGGGCLIHDNEGGCASGYKARRDIKLRHQMTVDKRIIKNWYDLMIKRANKRLEEEGLPWRIEGGEFKW